MTFKDALIRNSLSLLAADQHDCLLKKPVQSEKLQVAESKAKMPLDINRISGTYSQPMHNGKPKRIALPLRFDDKKTKDTIRRAAKADGRNMNNYIIRAALAKATDDLKRLESEIAI